MLWTYLIAGAVALVVLLILFRMVWRVAEPNEALIISGLGAHSSQEQVNETLGFKIVVGRGTAVLPGFQTVRRLPLDIRATPLTVTCVSSQGIPLHIKGVTAYKVGDDYGSIANAARRFLEQSDEQVMGTIHELFAGHLRAIVGSTTVEEMLHDRETLTTNIRGSLAGDMEKLGLVVDSLQIQEIDDESGYIRNLGRPQAAAVEAAARIAQAERDREATEREQVAAAAKAAAVRQSSIAQAGYQAEVDQANSKASQSGPLAEALARQEVVVAETETAKLNASLAEKQLESTVLKPADAEAYKQRTLAQAARDAQIAGAEAQAREVTLRSGATAYGWEIPAIRTREVEIHHVDLDAGYGPDDWDPDFAGRTLDQLAGLFKDARDCPVGTLVAVDRDARWEVAAEGPELTGSTTQLAAWLTGRSSGDGLVLSGAGEVPPAPRWS